MHLTIPTNEIPFYPQQQHSKLNSPNSWKNHMKLSKLWNRSSSAIACSLTIKIPPYHHRSIDLAPNYRIFLAISINFDRENIAHIIITIILHLINIAHNCQTHTHTQTLTHSLARIRMQHPSTQNTHRTTAHRLLDGLHLLR